MDQTLGNRRKPRVTVKGVTISINGKTYRIFNINSHGVGFLIDSPDEIEVGAEIRPIIDNGHHSVRVLGIARHISQLRPTGKGLRFTPGWVCGTEFTTHHDPDAGKLLKDYIAATIDDETEDIDNS